MSESDDVDVQTLESLSGDLKMEITIDLPDEITNKL